MKPNKFKTRVTITCDTPVSNLFLSKLKRCAAMLELYDANVMLKNIKVEEHERLLAVSA